jgi:hypothetical protein
MLKKLFILFLLITGSTGVQGACSKIYQQCGGQNWKGPVCCDSGLDCVFSNPYYSQCLPSSKPTSTPTSNPTPSPTLKPTPSPTSSPTTLTDYCLSATDFVIAYGKSSNVRDQGWTTKNGGGGVATKSTFNLLGGFVEYDIDFTETKVGVNANLYVVYPKISPTGFTNEQYCDGSAKEGRPWCPEFDFIESNGNCCGTITLHTIPGPGEGCTSWGCSVKKEYEQCKTAFNMKITFDMNGNSEVFIDGEKMPQLQPPPTANDIELQKNYMEDRGALIYSSQWTGWVPTCNKQCDSSEDLSTSAYTVKNLKIRGKLVQGPDARKC